jgi:hypothetical protein
VTFAELKRWAGELPTREPPPTEPELLSYAVPYPVTCTASQSAARHLAVTYMRSALEDRAQEGIAWVAPLAESVTEVEKRETNFWMRVVREGWAYYRVHCRVA